MEETKADSKLGSALFLLRNKQYLYNIYEVKPTNLIVGEGKRPNRFLIDIKLNLDIDLGNEIITFLRSNLRSHLKGLNKGQLKFFKSLCLDLSCPDNLRSGLIICDILKAGRTDVKASEEVLAFTRGLLEGRLAKLYKYQRQSFDLLFPKGVTDDKLMTAINLCDRTIEKNERELSRGHND
jgi:hypothetical protein